MSFWSDGDWASEMLILATAMPARVEFVGGYFDGVLLCPHDSTTTDVYSVMLGIRPNKPLFWHPQDLHTIHLQVEPGGPCWIYEQIDPLHAEDRFRWAFKGFANDPSLA